MRLLAWCIWWFLLWGISAGNLSKSDRSANACDKKYAKAEMSVEHCDIDLDGLPEIIMKNKKMILALSQTGGAILEMCPRETPVNLLNTITRQEESYHKRSWPMKKKKTIKSAPYTISS